MNNKFKKTLVTLAIITIIATVMIGCTNEMNEKEVIATIEISEDAQFLLDLQQYVSQQYAAIDNDNTRAEGNEMSDGELYSAIQTVDSLFQQFCTDHADYLVQFVPQMENMTEEELELILVDHDLFMDFARENFSQAFCEYLDSDQEGSYTRASATVGAMSPLEMTITSTLEVVSEFTNDDMDMTDPNKVVSCQKKYDEEMSMCASNFFSRVTVDVIAWIIADGGVAMLAKCASWQVFVGALGLETGAVLWEEWLNFYIPCTNDAENNRKKCEESSN